MDPALHFPIPNKTIKYIQFFFQKVEKQFSQFIITGTGYNGIYVQMGGIFNSSKNGCKNKFVFDEFRFLFTFTEGGRAVRKW